MTLIKSLSIKIEFQKSSMTIAINNCFFFLQLVLLVVSITFSQSQDHHEKREHEHHYAPEYVSQSIDREIVVQCARHKNV